MSFTSAVLDGMNLLYYGLYAAVGIAGLVGFVLILMTRADAFEVGDRQPKAVWAALVGVSAFVLLIPMPGLSIFTWVGAVIVGLYWFDVRPQLKDIIGGATNAW